MRALKITFIIFALYQFSQCFLLDKNHANPMHQCIEIFLRRYNGRGMRNILIRDAPIGINKTDPKSCQNIKVLAGTDVGKCFNSIMHWLTIIEDEVQASQRTDFSNKKKQKIYDLINNTFSKSKINIRNDCNLNTLAAINSMCANKLYIAIEQIVDYKPLYASHRKITKSQIETSVEHLNKLIQNIFSAKMSDSMAHVCN